jgi:hypothetical protein
MSSLMDVLKIEKATLHGFDWGRADRQHRRGALAERWAWSPSAAI